MRGWALAEARSSERRSSPPDGRHEGQGAKRQRTTERDAE
jgi:hypothetical protein